MKRNDFHKQRDGMVRTQLMERGIQDPATLHAMGRVPREYFVPEEFRTLAYEDRPLPIGEGQTISQPYMVALMTEALKLKGDERILEIGTGSGYQTAVLAEIVRRVFTIERIPSLAKQAEQTLQELGFTHVNVLTGDGTRGDPEHAPFDAILVTAGAPIVPASLQSQLTEGGRLVIPVGNRRYQELYRMTRHGKNLDPENLGGCVFVPLIGIEGWDLP